MTFTPKLLQEYRECERALQEVERLLQTENPDAAALSRLEKILSAESDAMAMLKRHREYGVKAAAVLGKIEEKLKPFIVGKKQKKIGFCVEPKDKPRIITPEDAMAEGNWASCISQLREKNIEIATARQIAELRMSSGKNSDYCTKGSWVGDSFNYLPDGRIIVALRDYNNPLLKYPEEATKAHIAGKAFYLDDEIVEGLLAAEKKGNALLLERKDIMISISVDAFGNEPLTFFLGWWKDYGNFLKGCNIENVNLYVCDEKYVKKQKQAFSRALWASDLSSDSALFGYYNLLDYDDGRAFGVRVAGADGASNICGGINFTG